MDQSAYLKQGEWVRRQREAAENVNVATIITQEDIDKKVAEWKLAWEKTEKSLAEPKIIDLEYHNHPLFPVLMRAIEQATNGKGMRHGGDRTPFMEQPWKHYAELHGRGFLTGQAAKKLEEAASIKSGEAFIQEALGAIIYIAMAIINEEESNKNDKNLG